MRPRFVIFTLLAVFLVLALAFWLRPSKQSRLSEPDQIQATAGTYSTNPASLKNTAQNIHSRSNNSATSALAIPKPAANGNDTVVRDVQSYNEEHNLPIQFYGLVVDQDSNSVPNAKVSVSIMQQHLSSPTANGDFPLSNNIVRLEEETGLDGRFAVSGELGQGVTIDSVQKAMYEVEPDHVHHAFGPSAGTLDSPIIFKMWNTNIQEQLVTGDKKFQIIPDGKPYFIDLATGEISQTKTSDLKVWIKYPEQTIAGEYYDWSCGIEVINGGLLQADAYSMLYAPSGDYNPSFSLEKKVKAGSRGSLGEKRFYVMLNNGRIFGRIQIDLIAPFNNGIPGLIRLSYAINPSGARILR